MLQQKTSLLFLFKHALKPGGAYFIEDLQTSCFPSHGGILSDNFFAFYSTHLIYINIILWTRFILFENVVFTISKNVVYYTHYVTGSDRMH